MDQGFSGLSFNSSNNTFSPAANPSTVSSAAFNSYMINGMGSNIFGSDWKGSGGGGYSYTPVFGSSQSFGSGSSGSGESAEARAARLRQEDIKASTERTKSGESLDAAEENTPTTSEAVEIGGTDEKKEEGQAGQETETKGGYQITESSAPLSSQIDNTSKSKKKDEPAEGTLSMMEVSQEGPKMELKEDSGSSEGQKGKEIENSIEAQAKANVGDVLNGKTLTAGDISWAEDQMKNKLPKTPDLNYTPVEAPMAQAAAPEQGPSVDVNEIVTGQEGQMAQSELAPQSPTMEDNEPTYQLDVGREGNLAGNEATERVSAEMPEGTPQDVRTQEINKAWENSGVSAEDREKITRVYGDKLTAGQINFMAKTGIIDTTVKVCDKISEFKDLRAQNKEATEDQLMGLLTDVNKLRDALEDPKNKLYTSGMGNAFNKEDCKEEVALVSEVIDQMNELYPQAQSINDQIKAINPGDEVQLVKKGLLTAENAGLQYLWQETMGGLYGTKLAAGSRYMEQEEFTQTALDMAAQNAQVYGDEAGKVITENACVGLMTGNRSLTDMAFRSLGQSGLSTGGKGIAKLFTMVEEKGGKAFAEKLTSAVSEGVDALEAMKDTCLDEIARGKGKAEPYLNLAKGVGKIVAGLAGALVTGGASLKLCLSGANDLANISWTWQNAKLGVQIEGMQAILDVMAKTIEMEPDGTLGKDMMGESNDSQDGVTQGDGNYSGDSGPRVIMGNIDPTGNGTSRYERKKKSLEGLNYNSAGSGGWNEGIGSEEEMAGLYGNLIKNDEAARRFANDLQAS